MSNIEKKLKDLNINLLQVKPVANYVSVQRDGNTLYFSGAGPIIEGQIIYKGRLGENVSIQEGYDASKIAAINLLSVLKKEIGDLDKVDQIIKVLGFVASTNDFYNQPAVIDGASDLFVELFGEKGKHARCAVGVNVLPMNLPVEVEMIVRIKPE